MHSYGENIHKQALPAQILQEAQTKFNEIGVRNTKIGVRNAIIRIWAC
ncbi:MAG: hypothetical protein LBG92_01215 [Prevotellaceae bacterium]|nr:hypothetical protein [Prevotellaceae bacterium]